MNIFPIYRAIRALLRPVATTFPYIGQYQPGKDNTSYKVPAIYIEMPKDLKVQFYPGKLKAARDIVKIHVINNAPYKNTDSDAQDINQDEHQTMVNAVIALMNGWVVKREDGKLLTQQFIQVGGSMNNYTGMQVFSILDFTTELYDRSLQ